MWVYHRLISVVVVLLIHFERCRRRAKKLRCDRDDQRHGALLCEEWQGGLVLVLLLKMDRNVMGLKISGIW